MPLPDHLRPVTTPLADPAASIVGDNYRITVLTARLLRLEYSPSGRFEDRATQVVWHRRFDVPDFEVSRIQGAVRVRNQHFQLDYNEQPFSPNGLTVRALATGLGQHNFWRFATPADLRWGIPTNLGGTARTLDGVDGAVELSEGLVSVMGIAALDDSASLALDADGWPAPRVPGNTDLYLFVHGHDAAGVLADFYALTGPQPLLPRFALGNWWSRYHRYSAAEYDALMDRFAAERLPFSVGVIDMDWHLVDVDPAYGSGWTGYTWNRELFPDPDAFLAGLHERGLKVALNVHPADGVRAFEDCYPAVAAAMGVDPASEQPIEFDIADPDFVAAYFEQVHHPMERQGVDFWWVDWQQGGASSIAGLDPLWLLNHLHFLDSGRDGRRRLTFSRYAGPGSHRYPIGFSGDSVNSWASLDFQPYFTATASNIGYGWWSHDIGGHMWGARSDELVARWFQLGTFSPINRLHSTQNPFQGKEPWRYDLDCRVAMGDALRLRHRLLPYLYTMNARAHFDGLALVRPLYHLDPRLEAIQSHNTYFFGSELVVAAITTPRNPALKVGKVRTWLPAGRWTDFFTGVAYTGGRWVQLHRRLDEYPVLAKAGAIIPLLGGDDLAVANPRSLEVRVYAGADGALELYEDDDAATPRAVRTTLRYDDSAGTFEIEPARGELDVVPEVRSYLLKVVGLADVDAESHAASYDSATNTLTVEVGDVPTAAGAIVRLTGTRRLAGPDVTPRVFELLQSAEIDYAVKDAIWAVVEASSDPVERARGVAGLGLDPDLLDVLNELLLT